MGKEKRRFKNTHEGTFAYRVENTAELFVVKVKQHFEENTTQVECVRQEEKGKGPEEVGLRGGAPNWNASNLKKYERFAENHH